MTTVDYAPSLQMKVTTRYNADLIESMVDSESALPQGYREVSRHVIRLQDEGVRKALVALGWTPPVGESA